MIKIPFIKIIIMSKKGYRSCFTLLLQQLRLVAIFVNFIMLTNVEKEYSYYNLIATKF